MKQPVLTQKTISETIHSDGTKTVTTVILETIPDTLEKIQTTTVVKEFTIEKDCDGNASNGKEGQIMVEEVTETTVTKKRIYYKEKKREETSDIEVGWGGMMLCGGNNPVARGHESDHEDDLTMDTALHLDTFAGKTVGSNNSRAANSNTSRGSNKVKDSDEKKSGFAMFTSPSAFFRKTNPPVIEEAQVEKSASSVQGQSSQQSATQSQSAPHTQQSSRKKAINLDEEILNIVKKEGKDVSKSSTYSATAAPPLSQQLEQTRTQQQSRQTNSSKFIDHEVRQESETRESAMTRSSPLPILGPRPSTTPKAAAVTTTKPTRPSSRPSSRQSTQNLSSPPPTLTKSSSNRSSSKTRKKDAMKPTVPKHKQSLLATDSDFASPKLTLSTTTAAVTDDQFLHFFSYQTPSINPSLPTPGPKSLSSKWRKSTTVSIENTYCMNVCIHNDTAVVGVPYDRNSKGLLTGAAYIFEREANKDIWTQVKKIVPKEATEFATVGYSVGIHDDVIVVSVPNVGSTHPVGGSVHVYRRVQKYKWSDKGALVPPSTVALANVGVTSVGKKDVQITAVNKSKNSASSKKKFGTRVAVQGNVVVVSDHYDHNETCVYVFEYDDFSLKWVCVQDDLLSKAQQRHFGSRLALTNNGNGILIGCHAKMCPTEILYYSRYGTGGKFHLQQVIVVSKRSSSYGVGRGVVGKNGVTEDITDFKVDDKNLMIGTASSVGHQNQHCVYIYQLQDNDTWILMAKVDDPSMPSFGQCVGLAGNRAMIASRGNAYSYNLDSLIPKAKRKEFTTTANIAEEKKKKQLKPQVKYVDPEYLELPYIGSDLNDFRTRQQIALHSSPFARHPSADIIDNDRFSQNSGNSPRMSLSMTRPKAAPKKTIMQRMRSPSPILRRLKGSSPTKRNISAPPLRPTSSSMARR